MLELGNTIECRIEALVLGGRALARVDGLVVLLDGGLPGETVEARVLRRKKRHAEAQTLRVLAPSPHRVEPFCPHFGRCGGCSHQDLAYAEQLAWKQRQVLETLERIGKAKPERVLPAIPSPLLTHYRNKMEFAFDGRGADLALGLHARGESGKVLDIAECPIGPKLAGAILALARTFCRDSRIPAFDPETGRGFWRHLVVRYSESAGRLLVHCITADDEPRLPAAQALGEALLAAVPEIVSYVHSTRKSRRALAFGERIALALGEPGLAEVLRLDGRELRFAVSPNAFFQTNTRAAELLYAAGLDLLGLAACDSVLDLYCGSGGMSLFLAAKAGQVVGFDLSAEAVADARRNAERNGLANCRFETLDLGAVALPQGLPQPRAVVLDPPRQGADPRAIETLLALAPEKLLFVSCDPATLARDVERLSPRYALDAVRVVDLFPHTPHVESLTLLERR